MQNVLGKPCPQIRATRCIPVDWDEVEEILAAGAERARKIAREVLWEARARVGLD